MIEYAVVVDGEIVNVITTSGGPPEWPGGGLVVPLDTLPLATKERYRYWNERP